MKKIAIFRYEIIGLRKFPNLLFYFIFFLGSICFLGTSIQSLIMSPFVSYHLKKSYLFLNNDNILSFFPQGLVIGFYGLLGLLFCLYLVVIVFLRIGDGFTEFNKKEGLVRIFRWGFPGKNRRIESCYSINDIKSIKLVSNTKEGDFIYLSMKGDIEISIIGPIGGSIEGTFSLNNDLESEVVNISELLGVPFISD